MLKTLLLRLAALLAGVALLAFTLPSCATSRGDVDVAKSLSTPVDTAVQRLVEAQRARDVLHQLSTGRLKFKGPVVIQLGGTGNQAGATNADKAKAPVAAAPGAVATETKTSSGPPWYVYLGGALVIALLGVGLGAWLRGNFSPLSILK